MPLREVSTNALVAEGASGTPAGGKKQPLNMDNMPVGAPTQCPFDSLRRPGTRTSGPGGEAEGDENSAIEGAAAAKSPAKAMALDDMPVGGPSGATMPGALSPALGPCACEMQSVTHPSPLPFPPGRDATCR